MSLRSLGVRRALAVAGVGAMAAAAAAAPAQGATLSQTYSCLYPLIQSQPLSVDIEASIPTEWEVNKLTPAFDIKATAVTNDTTWDGLNLVQAATIEGTATATSQITAPGFSLPLAVPVTVPVTNKPAQRGPITIVATGSTPPIAFPQTGDGTITVESLRMNLRAKMANGDAVIFPPVPGVPDSDGLPETFDVVCSLDPAGQNKKLTDIKIVPKPDDVDTEKPTAPGQPFVEAINDVTSTTAKINWAASTDNSGKIKEYEIRYDDVVVTVPGTQTSTTLTGLLPDSEYDITIVAIDEAGNRSDPSEAGLVITLPSTDDPPSAPANLRSTAVTETSVTLAWNASTDDKGVTGYEVWQNGAKVASPTGTTATITGLTADTQYSFQVLAKDTSNQTSPFSSALNVKTLASDKPPTAPTNLVGTPTATSVSLTWTAATDDKGISGYDVYRNGTKVSTVTTPSATISGLTPETSYQFKVQAVDTKPQTGPFSQEITVKTLAQSNQTVKYGYTLKGSSELKTLTRGSVGLTGTFDADLTLATGAFIGDLALNNVRARLQALGIIPVTADLQFVMTDKTRGTLDGAGKATAQAKFKVRMPNVYLFGSIKIAGGISCQTKSASVANLTSAGTFNPLTGGRLTGTYGLSDLTGCGALTAFVSPLTKGSGNTIDITLTAKS